MWVCVGVCVWVCVGVCLCVCACVQFTQKTRIPGMFGACVTPAHSIGVWCIPLSFFRGEGGPLRYWEVYSIYYREQQRYLGGGGDFVIGRFFSATRGASTPLLGEIYFVIGGTNPVLLTTKLYYWYEYL